MAAPPRSCRYAYVCGVASRREGCTAGTRDDGWNDGKSAADFEERVNAFIRERHAEGHGTLRSVESALLTREEVLAVRLYSGPAYQPINGFLRQLASLRGDFRTQLAQHADFTFSATVGHLCHAIRKLTSVATPQEARQQLWRGVRGELPRGFWIPDEQGMIVAVEMGFTSTSRNRQTPLSYMGSGETNILWQLHPQLESDVGYHYGADITLLSQFAREEEVLFPPCTMFSLLVDRAPRPEAPTAVPATLAEAQQAAGGSYQSNMPMPSQQWRLDQRTQELQMSVYPVEREGDKEFRCLAVTPTFL